MFLLLIFNLSQSDQLTSTQPSVGETSSYEDLPDLPDVTVGTEGAKSPLSDSTTQHPSNLLLEASKLAVRQTNFGESELEQLSKLWLHVSQDAIIGKDRRGRIFWNLIAKDLNTRLKSKLSTTTP